MCVCVGGGGGGGSWMELIVVNAVINLGPAKSFVTGFGLLQCYVLSNLFLLENFKVFPLY